MTVILKGILSTKLAFFFLVSWCGVRLSPLGTSATNWPIVPAPDDDDDDDDDEG
jgi:hypothetical protein